MTRIFIILTFLISCCAGGWAQSPAMPDTVMEEVESPFPIDTWHPLERPVESIYAFPEYNTNLGFQHPDWKRAMVNASVLCGAYVAALLVLECLPEDATTWNRASLQSIPLFTRWKQHVIIDGPEWDHDNPMFNFVLHPYSGAVYFMAGRSCGLSFWGSLLYSTCISTIAWEFGIEAFMERPSWQDIFITPLVGAAMGEGFFRVKRYLVANNYRLFGSPVVGNIVAFLVDPVNEVVGLIGGNPARKYAKAHALEISSQPGVVTAGKQMGYGLNLSVRF